VALAYQPGNWQLSNGVTNGDRISPRFSRRTRLLRFFGARCTSHPKNSDAAEADTARHFQHDEYL